MSLRDKRKGMLALIVALLIIAGWAAYAKHTNILFVSLIAAIVLAALEETIIRWL